MEVELEFEQGICELLEFKIRVWLGLFLLLFG